MNEWMQTVKMSCARSSCLLNPPPPAPSTRQKAENLCVCCACVRVYITLVKRDCIRVRGHVAIYRHRSVYRV